MADHVRKRIRDAVVTTLTGLTTTGSRVFRSRVYSVEASTLPCLLVYTPSEIVDLETGTLDAPQRLLNVNVHGIVKATEDLDDDLDQIAKEVETAMRTDITLGGLSHGLDYSGYDTDLTSEGDQPHGTITLTYIIKYRTPFGDPTTVA